MSTKRQQNRRFQVNTEPKMSRVVNLAVVEGTGTLGPGPALALKVACCNMFFISFDLILISFDPIFISF